MVGRDGRLLQSLNGELVGSYSTKLRAQQRDI